MVLGRYFLQRGSKKISEKAIVWKVFYFNLNPHLQHDTGSKSFLKKHTSSLQNLTGIYCYEEKSKEKKEFYSDVNLHQCPPQDPEESKGEESYKQFVEGICDLDKEEGMANFSTSMYCNKL